MKKTTTTLTFLFILNIVRAQLNPGFEEWENLIIYKNPKNWETLNILSVSNVANISCNQSKNARTGLYSVAISALKIKESGFSDTLAGVATQQFAYTKRANYFNFYYKYKTRIDSKAYALIYFVNAGEVIGESEVKIEPSNASDDWAFSKNEIYWTTNQIPDTAFISFNSAEKDVTDTLWVDDISLTAQISSISSEKIINFKIFINNNDELIVKNQSLNTPKNISISNTLGEILITKNEDLESVDIKNLVFGVYFCKIQTEKGISVYKFIKQ